MNHSISLLGLTFRNPLVSASGWWTWMAEDCAKTVAAGAGGVTTKSFWNHEHTGNPMPNTAREEAWTLNAVGLPDKGPVHSQGELEKMLAAPEVPFIVSILGLSAEEYAENARRIAPLKPQAFEVNMSSPTFLKLRGSFFDIEEALAIIPAVKKEAGSIPVFAKLSPNVGDIGAFAQKCVEAGADGIAAINTLGTGMAIDLESRIPKISAIRGGISGPGIKPLAVRCIADIRSAVGPSVPIIGMGGVMRGTDAIELMMAGAHLIGLATAVIREGNTCYARVLSEMEAWCDAHGVQSYDEIIGSMKLPS